MKKIILQNTDIFVIIRAYWMLCSTCFCLFFQYYLLTTWLTLMWDFLTCSWWTTYGISSEISACLWLWETALILQISTWLLVRSECFIMSHTKMSSALGETDSLNTNKWIPFYYSVWVKRNRIWVQVWGESCLAQWHLQGLSGVWWHCGRHLWMYSSSPFRGSTLPERWEITLDHRCADCNCSNMTGMNLLGDSTRLETFDCNIYVIPSHSFFPDINECEDAVSVCGQYSDCINIIGSHMCSCWSGFNTSNKDSPVSRNNSCQGKCYYFFLYIFILWTWVYRAALSLHFQYYC